jgi:hypothetical protein
MFLSFKIENEANRVENWKIKINAGILCGLASEAVLVVLE